MFTPPRIVPHELVQAPEDGATEIHELDVDSYGDCYDMTSYEKVMPAPKIIDPDDDGE